MIVRYWRYWTKGKLSILRRYLDAFTTTTKNRVTERIYIDAFAGQPENRAHYTGELLESSPRIALTTTDPPFTKLLFFETDHIAPKLEESLRDDFPNRDFDVFAGDCNELIPQELDRIQDLNWAPTFAFVDPNGPDTHWNTLQALAQFRAAEYTKAEIWLLFATGMFTRLLRVTGQMSKKDAIKMTQMYGTEQWRSIYDARVDQIIEPSSAREEYVNLMRWRLERELGYRWTHPLEVVNERGNPIYYMIFATDHQAGTRIMTSLYRRASEEFPAMRKEALRRRERLREQESGIRSLFDEEEMLALTNPSSTSDPRYTHIPPWTPLE